MNEEYIYEELYQSTIPSVVSVYVTSDRLGGAGSGFVYDTGAMSPEAGYIVTNEHVVRTDDEVDIRFSDGDWRVGQIVGTDAYTDLAVVRVANRPEYARVLSLASENPAPGKRVAALGNPMGLDGSLTTGVVSGANRSMPTQEGFTIPDTVQTDAPINPGNSGGPLVTTDGEVVGVNRARGGDNIGFAISAEITARVVPTLIEHSSYRHSYLKIQTIDISPTIAAANGLDESRGVLVVEVSLGPASGALIGCRGNRQTNGRQVPVGGDVITHIDGQRIDSHEELMRYLLLETQPNDTVSVDIIRDGVSLTEHVTLAERPRPTPRRGPNVRVR